MANSLRNKIKHLCYKGYFSESERDRLLNALDDADRINSELEPCDDCISRKEALRLIDKERQHLLRLNMDGAEHIIVHYARRIIEDMPSASSVDCIDRQKTIAEIQYKYYDNAIGIDIVDMIAHMPAAIPEQLGEHFAEGYKKGVENE
jgi:hypothetical protein